MAFRIKPQKREFFDLFTQSSANAVAIAAELVELLNGWPESRGRLREIRELEHEGDRLTHEVINLLNRTFVTPFDRDDMYRLASVIDDVCDHVDEAADNIDAYEVRDVPQKAREQAEVIHRAAERLDEAVERGWYCSFAGNATYPSAKELLFAAAKVPEDRILVETDAPYLAPQPKRGKRNQPAYVVETAREIAEVRGVSYEELERTVEANARTLFGW